MAEKEQVLTPGRLPSGSRPLHIHPQIQYSTVWEDADILCDAIRPVATASRILSIASAGDNVLALLTLDPAEIVAVDRSLAQLACLHFRMAAFRCLDEDSLLQILGVKPSSDRLALYRKIRLSLPFEFRSFWDGRERLVQRGILHTGRLETYVSRFCTFLLPLVHSRSVIAQLLAARCTGDEGLALYDQLWNTASWRFMFRLFFNRFIMERLGRNRSYFRNVEAPVASTLLHRVGQAFAFTSPADNPYLHWLLTSQYPTTVRPLYLRRENIPIIRDRLDRINVKHCEIDDVRLGDSFSAFNLSDIFEYTTSDQYLKLYRAIIRKSVPGARFVYWNLFVTRSAETHAISEVRSLKALSALLHARDKVCSYANVHVEEAV